MRFEFTFLALEGAGDLLAVGAHRTLLLVERRQFRSRLLRRQLLAQPLRQIHRLMTANCVMTDVDRVRSLRRTSLLIHVAQLIMLFLNLTHFDGVVFA